MSEISEQERYQEYLCSREWGLLKEEVRLRSGGMCERCRINPGYAVHHLTYIRKYAELPEDLQFLCELCHDFVHGKSDIDPLSTFEHSVCLDDDGVLHCPHCKGSEDSHYLHHERVIIYSRRGEDGDITRTRIDRDGTSQQSAIPAEHSRNPSSRRDGITIDIWCENCDNTFELTIAQHKGQTFIEWREWGD